MENVYDLVSTSHNESVTYNKFSPLHRFLSNELFAQRDLCISYDRSKGIYFRDSKTQNEFQTFFKTPLSSLIRSPVSTFKLLEQFFRYSIPRYKSIGLIIHYTETILPQTDIASSSSEERDLLVFLLRWAQDPLFLAADSNYYPIGKSTLFCP